MTRSQIVGINKPDRYSQIQHITHVQILGPRSLPTVLMVEDVVSRILYWGDEFFTLRNGFEANVEVVRRNGFLGHPDDYIRTVPDDSIVDNLLSLPEADLNPLEKSPTLGAPAKDLSHYTQKDP